MNRIRAVIETDDASVSAFLAGESLRRAAERRDHPIDVEVRSALGVRDPIPAGAFAAGDMALFVTADGTQTTRDDRRFGGIEAPVFSIAHVIGDADAVIAKLAAIGPEESRTRLRIVAVTSCPTGIAHTFMAAEGLQEGARRLGHEIRVETQGSVGSQSPLTADEIAAADFVIIAADREVDRSRFAGKRLFLSNTKPAITGGAALIERAATEAMMQAAETPAGEAAASPAPERAGPYKHLMTGVSFMLPFVVAGGLMIALAFAIGGIYASDDARAGTLAHALFLIGAKGGFALIVPALAGYIAFSIANRPGIAPGMVGGVLAANLGAGFLGGIAAGFIAGYGTDLMSRHIRLPRTLAGLKPVLILPLLGTLLTGLLMIYAVGTPVAALLQWLTEWLRSMQGTRAVLLGLLLGGMAAFDMGGPVNKAAYAFSTGLIASQVYTPMAATMVAGMTPPLAVALATRLFANRFSADEREAGSAAAVLGLAYVTEGAIPFAARDPFRVIPSLVAGSALAGAISMQAGVELKVPHGGIFVLPIPGAVTHLPSYLAALVAGTALSVVMLGVLKKRPAQDMP